MRATLRGMSAPAWGLAAALALIAAAVIVPAAAGWSVFVDFPPLHARWAPRLGPGTLPSLVIGGLAVWFGARLADRLRWRWLLLVAYGAGLAWLLSLAVVDGLDGIQTVLDLKTEYLRTARAVTDLGATLREYVDRIPLDSAHHWPVHIAGHPPGALLFFVGLVHLGLGSGLAAGLVVIVLAATTPVAVLVTLRRLGVEDAARRVAPFLVIGTAAIWMAVSADALFGAVAAWGLCCLALAATSRRWFGIVGWSVAAGALLGYCVMFSYGLVLLAVPAVGILIAARSWRALPGAIVAAAAVVLGFACAGFVWWEAYPVLVTRYWGGIASDRPATYWLWGNLAALTFSAGPILGASIASAATAWQKGRWRGVRVVTILVAAAAASILLADLSGMSKAEVERIWLPFVPWLLLGTALLPERWRRPGLAVQVVAALLIEHLLATTW
ncbi:glycosyltransferase family 39 protein [soil metagenome]